MEENTRLWCARSIALRVQNVFRVADSRPPPLPLLPPVREASSKKRVRGIIWVSSELTLVIHDIIFVLSPPFVTGSFRARIESTGGGGGGGGGGFKTRTRSSVSRHELFKFQPAPVTRNHVSGTR